jgi:hypothetical protein
MSKLLRLEIKSAVTNKQTKQPKSKIVTGRNQSTIVSLLFLSRAADEIKGAKINKYYYYLTNSPCARALQSIPAQLIVSFLPLPPPLAAARRGG